MKNCKGFTLIELVMIIVILGILALAVMPKTTAQPRVKLEAACQKIASDLRYAQEMALVMAGWIQRKSIWSCRVYSAKQSLRSPILHVWNPGSLRTIKVFKRPFISRNYRGLEIVMTTTRLSEIS